MTNQELIDRIPTYATGVRKGLPLNDRLREIRFQLMRYRFTEQEIGLLAAEIESLIPERVKRKRLLEKENIR